MAQAHAHAPCATVRRGPVGISSSWSCFCLRAASPSFGVHRPPAPAALSPRSRRRIRAGTAGGVGLPCRAPVRDSRDTMPTVLGSKSVNAGGAPHTQAPRPSGDICTCASRHRSLSYTFTRCLTSIKPAKYTTHASAFSQTSRAATQTYTQCRASRFACMHLFSHGLA